MAKNTRGTKEYSREQKLSKENKQLKKELSRLMKELSRLDVSRFETVKEMCNDYEEGEKFKEKIDDISSSLESLRKDWACKKCETGWLEITLYSKLGQTHYYRKCVDCDNRTKGKRYDSKSVKGIIVKSQKE